MTDCEAVPFSPFFNGLLAHALAPANQVAGDGNAGVIQGRKIPVFVRLGEFRQVAGVRGLTGFAAQPLIGGFLEHDVNCRWSLTMPDAISSISRAEASESASGCCMNAANCAGVARAAIT